MSETVEILGVRFDKVTLEEAANKALEFAKDKEQHYICTPNPEIVLEAQKNEEFSKILNGSAMNIPDGIGIIWAAKYLKKGSLQRVTGVDLMEKICEKAAKKNLKIFLLGAEEGIAEKVKTILENKYAGLKITGVYSGSPEEKEKNLIIKKINDSGAEILFVAFGAPKQEIWISKNLKNLNNVKLSMGVGGSFDFIACVRKRAPKWMQKIGLEWVYRLIQQPSRSKRIYNATIKFPITVLKKNLK
ncbi:MAG: WecB/TagA/CpsF family glycosyltransferase [Patescibacteria group bacterium]